MRRLALVILLLPAIANAQVDIHDRPLPSPIITQSTYDSVATTPYTDPVNGCLTHWVFSGWTIVTEQAERIRAQNELKECVAKLPPECDETFHDGAGGKLWKPHSENTGMPVVLLPFEMQLPYQQVVGEVFSNVGDKITDLTFRTCCPNGGRFHADVNLPAETLDRYAPIVLKFLVGPYECLRVDNPKLRND